MRIVCSRGTDCQYSEGEEGQPASVSGYNQAVWKKKRAGNIYETSTGGVDGIMEIKTYNFLPQAATAVRTAVFIEEQGFVNEMDDIDRRAAHLVMWDGEIPVATCRVFPDIREGVYILGRLAVMKAYRGKNIGAEMMKNAEEYVRNKGGSRIILHAQCTAMEFYRKQGYTEQGEIEEEEGCPHMWMAKELNSVRLE